MMAKSISGLPVMEALDIAVSIATIARLNPLPIDKSSAQTGNGLNANKLSVRKTANNVGMTTNRARLCVFIRIEK